jgi:hypothetical protein
VPHPALKVAPPPGISARERESRSKKTALPDVVRQRGGVLGKRLLSGFKQGA